MRSDRCPYKEGTFEHRHVHREEHQAKTKAKTGVMCPEPRTARDTRSWGRHGQVPPQLAAQTAHFKWARKQGDAVLFQTVRVSLLTPRIQRSETRLTLGTFETGQCQCLLSCLKRDVWSAYPVASAGTSPLTPWAWPSGLRTARKYISAAECGALCLAALRS